MAASIDDYLNGLRQQKTQPIMQAWQKAKDTLGNEQTQLQQQQDQKTPTYDIAKNGEDQGGWQRQQALMRNAQATGNTTTDQLNTGMAVINQGTANNKMGVEMDKQAYLRDMANRMNQVKQQMTENDLNKEQNLASMEGELASTKAKYQMDQQAAAAAAARSMALASSRATAKGPSASEIARADKQNASNAMAQAMQGVDGWANQHMTRSDILGRIRQNAADLQANGVDPRELYTWASDTYRYDKDQYGNWYNVDDKNYVPTPPKGQDEGVLNKLKHLFGG